MKLQRSYTVNGQEYLVRFIRDVRWPEIVVYEVNPQRKFFGRLKRVYSELECILMYQAEKIHNINTFADDALIKVGELALQDYLNSQKRNIWEVKTAERQAKAFCR